MSGSMSPLVQVLFPKIVRRRVWPTHVCGDHQDGKPRLTAKEIDQRRRAGRISQSLRTPEQRTAICRAAGLARATSVSLERQQEIGRMAGAASKASMTPAQRSASAKRAAIARWSRGR